MVSLKQIKTLQDRVNKALNFIELLKEENETLKATLDRSQLKIQEFEKLITDFKNDQTEIEQTILDVIQKLDTLEDEIPGVDSPDSSIVQPESGDSVHHESDEPLAEEESSEENTSTAESPENVDSNDNSDDESAPAEEPERDLDIF